MARILMPMRTTLTLDDDIVKMARRKAGAENRPFKDIVNEALRIGLQAGAPRRSGYKFSLKTVKGRLQPGVDLSDRDKLFDLMEGR